MFVVEQKRGVVHVIMMWVARIGVALAWYAFAPLVLLGIIAAVWFAGRFGAATDAQSGPD